MTTNIFPNIVVRPATTDDIEFMVHLFLQINYQLNPLGEGVNVDAIVNGTRDATLEQVQGKIADSITNVVEVDQRRVGRLRVIRSDNEIMVAGLQILPGFQSQGIGSTVISELIEEARSKSVPVVLEVEKDNPAAEKLYARLGFKHYGETEAAYKMRLQAA